MELVINIIVYMFAFLGLLVTFITIFGKCIIIDNMSKCRNYSINKSNYNKKIRYYKK